MQPANLLTWVLAVFLGLLELTVLWHIWFGKINISLLISESDGSASMSRFQMLVFTFVVAASLFIITVSEPKGFPEIPTSVLELIGISAGTYAVAKGIQTQGELGGLDAKTTPPAGPTAATASKDNPAAGGSTTVTTTTVGSGSSGPGTGGSGTGA